MDEEKKWNHFNDPPSQLYKYAMPIAVHAVQNCSIHVKYDKAGCRQELGMRVGPGRRPTDRSAINYCSYTFVCTFRCNDADEMVAIPPHWDIFGKWDA